MSCSHSVRAVLLAACCAAIPAAAFEFRALSETAVLYDAPSSKAKKLFVMNAGSPVEVVVAVTGWAKVRDVDGELAWVESRLLGEQHNVLVSVPLAEVREAADENSRLLFRAQRSVILEVLAAPENGWVRIQHRDGQIGFVRQHDLWGM